MCIVAYVSGHGFGHSAREVEILRRILPDIPLVVKTVAPEWFWREEMGRPFEYVPDSFDVGCIQQDSIRVDVPATRDAWQEMYARNQTRRESEAADLKRRGAKIVVTDVAPFPLGIASELGIPALCVANFTWADIYAGYIAEEPAFGPVVARMEAEYAQAICLEADLALPMPYFHQKENVGLVARPYTARRKELLAQLGQEAAGKRLALVYLGNWGFPIPFERLEVFSDWQFLSLSPPPVPVRNWSVVGRDWMRHSDLVASVDLVITKPGYGIVGECLHAGTPLLYCSRPNFAEYAALDSVLRQWPGGRFLEEKAFLEVAWKAILEGIPAPGTVPGLSAPGGENAAATILSYYK
jgi:hypothetical protein